MAKRYHSRRESSERVFSPLSRRGMWLTVFLFCLALGVEMLYIKTYPVPYFISPDGLHYANIAENFLQGQGLVNTVNYAEGPNYEIQAVEQPREYVVGPVYPLLLALVFALFGVNNYAMVILGLHALLGAASAVLAYKTGVYLFGRKYAWIPFGLTLGYPLFAYWGMYVLTEVTYVFTITLFLYFSARYAQEGKNPQIRTLVCLGVVVGISNLVRPMLLLYLPVMGCWILWLRHGNFKRALRDFGVVVLLAIVIMSPWWIRNGIRYHQFIIASNYGSYEVYLGNNPLTVTDQYFYFKQPSYDPVEKARIEQLPVAEQEKEYKKLAVSYILAHPVAFVQRTLAKEKNLFWQPVSSADGEFYKMQGYSWDRWYLYLGLLGLFLSLFRLKKYSFLLLFTLYYSFFISMITVVSGARYRLPVMPAWILLGSLVFVLAFKGVEALVYFGKRGKRRAVRR